MLFAAVQRLRRSGWHLGASARCVAVTLVPGRGIARGSGGGGVCRAGIPPRPRGCGAAGHGRLASRLPGPPPLPTPVAPGLPSLPALPIPWPCWVPVAWWWGWLLVVWVLVLVLVVVAGAGGGGGGRWRWGWRWWAWWGFCAGAGLPLFLPAAWRVAPARGSPGRRGWWWGGVGLGVAGVVGLGGVGAAAGVLGMGSVE